MGRAPRLGSFVPDATAVRARCALQEPLAVASARRGSSYPPRSYAIHGLVWLRHLVPDDVLDELRDVLFAPSVVVISTAAGSRRRPFGTCGSVPPALPYPPPRALRSQGYVRHTHARGGRREWRRGAPERGANCHGIEYLNVAGATHVVLAHVDGRQ